MMYVKGYDQTLAMRLLAALSELSTRPKQPIPYPLPEEKWIGLEEACTDSARSHSVHLWAITVLSPSRVIAVPVQKV